MKKTLYIEITLLAVLTILLFLLLDPFKFVMKLMLSGFVIGLLVMFYAVKFFIIWREKEVDERDLQHRFYSSWISYYTASVILVVGVLTESMRGMPDTWLVISLAGLFLAKLGSLVYLEIYH